MVATTAFLAGFYAALGGWTAYKLTGNVDKIISPPAINKQVEPIPVIIKQTEPVIVKQVEPIIDVDKKENTEK